MVAVDADVTTTLGDVTASVGGTADSQGCLWYLMAHPWAQSPSMRDNSTQRFGDDGDWDATQFFDAWQFELSVTVVGTPESLRLSQTALHKTLGRRGTSLRVVEPGYDRWQTVRRDGGVSWAYASGSPSGQSVARVQVPLKAPDPRLYSTTPRTLTASLGGLSAPPVPHAVAHAVGVSTLTRRALNAGTETAWPVWVLRGPLVDPVIANPLTGEVMRFDLSIPSGRFVEVDTRPSAWTVLQNGDRDQSLRGAMSGDWWGFAPGESSVVLSTSAGSAGSMSATWNDTWL